MDLAEKIIEASGTNPTTRAVVIGACPVDFAETLASRVGVLVLDQSSNGRQVSDALRNTHSIFLAPDAQTLARLAPGTARLVVCFAAPQVAHAAAIVAPGGTLAVIAPVGLGALALGVTDTPTVAGLDAAGTEVVAGFPPQLLALFRRRMAHASAPSPSG